jgi:hypothetical protein
MMDALGAGDVGADEGDDDEGAADDDGAAAAVATGTKGSNGKGVTGNGAVRVARYISIQVRSPSLCLPHRLPHCVSLTVSPSLCLPHCVSLTVSLTMSPSLSLSHVQVQEGRVALLSPHRLPEAKLVFLGTDVAVELAGLEMAVEASLSSLSLCAADGTAVVKSVDPPASTTVSPLNPVGYKDPLEPIITIQIQPER